MNEGNITMLDILIEECIRKVTFLEKSLGMRTQYQILEQKGVRSCNITK